MDENPDENFNYDILTVGASDGAIHRLTHQVGPKYGAVWSPDGSKIAYTHTIRPITSMETTAEDNHLYIMNADGSNAHLVTGQADLRYGDAAVVGRRLAALFHPAGPRPGAARARARRRRCRRDVVVGGEGSLGYSGWSLAKTGAVAYAYSTPASPPQLYVASGTGSPQQLTHLDQDVLGGKQIAPVERLEFKTNDGTLGGGVPDPSGRTSAPRPRPTPCPWW